MFHRFLYEWKPISDRKIQHKCRYNIQTAKKRKSVIRRKTTQDVRALKDCDVALAKRLGAVVGLEVTLLLGDK